MIIGRLKAPEERKNGWMNEWMRGNKSSLGMLQWSALIVVVCLKGFWVGRDSWIRPFFYTEHTSALSIYSLPSCPPFLYFSAHQFFHTRSLSLFLSPFSPAVTPSFIWLYPFSVSYSVRSPEVFYNHWIQGLVIEVLCLLTGFLLSFSRFSFVEIGLKISPPHH